MFNNTKMIQKKKNYIYPKLSKNDYWFFTVNGCGLANLLYMYSRALVFSKKNNLELIWPAWFSIHVRRIVELKKDKRWYHDLFVNRSNHISGPQKLLLLLTKKKVLVEKLEPNDVSKYKDTIFCFWGYYDTPLGSRNDSLILFNDLKRNLHPKHLDVFRYNYNDRVGIHIRLDDFALSSSANELPVKLNSRTPIEWYISVINRVRCVIGESVQIDIYSDGEDSELESVLKLINVRRHTFGAAISDMLALSQYKLLIGSASTFSVMARYLGRNNSISPEGNKREVIKKDLDEGFFEIELNMDDEIPELFQEKLKLCYQ